MRKKQKLETGEAVAVVESKDVPDGNQKAPEDAGGKAEKQRRSLFVRGLPATTTSESLTELFSESYPVKHATAVIDPATKQCRGYGFVTFADAEDAAGAKKEFSGHDLEGRKLRIEIAEARQREGGEAGAPKAVGEEAKLQGKKGQEAPQPSRLIVRNLPWTIKNSEQLGKLFLSYGKVKQAYIPKKAHGLMAGFGFVVLRGRKNAEKALEGINGKEIDGRTLAVDWAVSKEEYEDLLEGDGADPKEKKASSKRKPDGEDVDAADDEHIDDMSDGGVDLEDGSDSELDGSGSDDEDDVDIRIDGEAETAPERPDERSTTLFVRNLPFTCLDEDLEDHFSRFGNTRYARVVMDFNTQRSKGTGFVCFYKAEDAEACLRSAPKHQVNPVADDQKKHADMSKSILQNEENDPQGEYTMDGRVLQVSRAVDKNEANRLTSEGVAHRYKKNEDKRRLYLLSEGTIPSNSKLYEQLSPSERTMREASAKQRKTLIESNPSLHLSLTRLSIRNIPRSIGSKELKALAREAVVGFAKDVKAETRTRLSKEELARGGDEMHEAEQARKKAGKGVVRQAKVVFEGGGGGKVSEDSGAGRSRGYGFVEYYTHRSALMGLRWLNGHTIDYQVKDPKTKSQVTVDPQDRKKRLVVEFAIENVQVVSRRKDSEHKARERSKAVQEGRVETGQQADAKDGAKNSLKRKRGPDGKVPRGRGGQKQRADRFGTPRNPASQPAAVDAAAPKPKKTVDEKLVKRNQIIGRKRAMRKAKSGGK